MSAPFILSKIREHFPQMAENIDITHLNNAANLQHYLSLLACQIPNMPHQHLHQMCERQEKTVLSKIHEINHLDLYHEIHLINPTLNLRDLSNEEVSKKISCLKVDPTGVCGRDEEEEEELHFEIRSHRSEYDRRELKNMF